MVNVTVLTTSLITINAIGLIVSINPLDVTTILNDEYDGTSNKLYGNGPNGRRL